MTQYAHRGPTGECQGFCFTPRGSQWHPRRRADLLRVETICHDESSTRGCQFRTIKRRKPKPRGHRPEKAVAIIEIFWPFSIAAQVGKRDLDLNKRQPPGSVDAQYVSTPTTTDWHFRQRHNTGAKQQS